MRALATSRRVAPGTPAAVSFASTPEMTAILTVSDARAAARLAPLGDFLRLDSRRSIRVTWGAARR